MVGTENQSITIDWLFVSLPSSIAGGVGISGFAADVLWRNE